MLGVVKERSAEEKKVVPSIESFEHMWIRMSGSSKPLEYRAQESV
jgi:hypothetical protein